MKKGLMAGGILLGCVLLLSGIAAADVSTSTSGSVEFQVSGDPAGLFGGLATGYLTTTFSAAADSWEGGLTAEIAYDEEEGLGGTLALSDAFIQYTAEMATIKMEPLGVSWAMYDLEDNEEADIASDPGITLTADLASMTLTTVLNNADSGTNGVDWGYGIGGEYAADAITVGARYNSMEAYSVMVEGAMDPVTVSGAYVGYQDGTAYFAKAVYALSAGTVTAKYTSKDATYTGSADNTTEIFGELADFPITDTTTLLLSVTSVDDVLTYTGETATTLAENVTLTLNITSDAGTLSYFGKVGVSF